MTELLDLKNSIRSLKNKYKNILIEISQINQEIEAKDQQLNLELEIEGKFDDPSVFKKRKLSTSNNNYAKQISELKLELSGLGRNFDKEKKAITESLLNERQEKIIELEKEHQLLIKYFTESTDSKIKYMMENILKLKEKVSLQTEPLLQTELKNFDSLISNKHLSSLDKAPLILAIEKINSLVGRKSYIKKSQDSANKESIRYDDEEEDKEALIKRLSYFETTRKFNPQDFVLDNKKDGDSEVQPEEEDSYSDIIDLDDFGGEISINKVNCMKIDSEFFEKKNKFTYDK